ncbi:PIN domain-containing protein [Xylophilus sp. GW821-FHT01B05]
MILIDSNVLIDLIEDKGEWADWSAQALGLARQRDGLAINAIVYAEIARTFAGQSELDAFLADVSIDVRPVPLGAAFAASRAHQAYRAAGGARSATLPDFFIGAHALAEGWTLLTRDATRVRTYFPGVALICPDAS